VLRSTAKNERFFVDTAEVDAQCASYTVDTLERLRHELGLQQPLVLLLGADAFAGLSTWHRWQEIFALAHIAVAHRPGFQIRQAGLPPTLAAELAQRQQLDAASLSDKPAGRIVSFAMTPLAISATQIRQLIARGQSVRYLLPDPVLDYIQTHQLYQSTLNA
jgi:nicotinate-nucleotide adenylyltransferase